MRTPDDTERTTGWLKRVADSVVRGYHVTFPSVPTANSASEPMVSTIPLVWTGRPRKSAGRADRHQTF